MRNKFLAGVLIAVLLTVLVVTPLAIGATGSAPSPANICAIDHGRILVSTHRSVAGEDTAFSVGLTLTNSYCSELVGPSGVDTAPSIQSEIDSYYQALKLTEIGSAESRLAGDVDTGQKWISKLRDWQADSQNYYNQWPSMSDGAKDTVTREMLRRMGLTWSGLADLLTILDKGR